MHREVFKVVWLGRQGYRDTESCCRLELQQSVELPFILCPRYSNDNVPKIQCGFNPTAPLVTRLWEILTFVCG